jgi:hypothetical protein
MITSKLPAVIRSSPALASPMCSRIRPPRSGNLSRISRHRDSSTSTATCADAGRVAVT